MAERDEREPLFVARVVMRVTAVGEDDLGRYVEVSAETAGDFKKTRGHLTLRDVNAAPALRVGLRLEMLVVVPLV